MADDTLSAFPETSDTYCVSSMVPSFFTSPEVCDFSMKSLAFFPESAGFPLASRLAKFPVVPPDTFAALLVERAPNAPSTVDWLSTCDARFFGCSPDVSTIPGRRLNLYPPDTGMTATSAPTPISLPAPSMKSAVVVPVSDCHFHFREIHWKV